ncbi:peptidoglycan-binding protein [Micromonospora sp. NPDC006431]|uniref:peptidoglycan-binding domain-containing protein n=1 Tax=unclassified Micromonospora TaxID=2617518 RepID=UPI00367FD7EE
MSKRVVRRAVAAVLLVVTSGSVQLVGSGPASAATPTCVKSVTYQGALVPAASTNSVDCNMVRGNVSDGVARLQDTMNDCYPGTLRAVGVYPLIVDGNFGGNTQKALIEVQKVARTTADGVYGPNTRKAMLHVDPDYGDPCRRVS